jgi:hypothetical protein
MFLEGVAWTSPYCEDVDVPPSLLRLSYTFTFLLSLFYRFSCAVFRNIAPVSAISVAPFLSSLCVYFTLSIFYGVHYIKVNSAAGKTEVQSLRQRIDFLESLLRDSRPQSVSAYFGGAARGLTSEESASGSSPNVMQSPSSYAQLATSSQRREERDLVIQESYDYHVLKRAEPAQQNRADSDEDDDDPGLSSAVPLVSPFLRLLCRPSRRGGRNSKPCSLSRRINPGAISWWTLMCVGSPPDNLFAS